MSAFNVGDRVRITSLVGADGSRFGIEVGQEYTVTDTWDNSFFIDPPRSGPHRRMYDSQAELILTPDENPTSIEEDSNPNRQGGTAMYENPTVGDRIRRIENQNGHLLVGTEIVVEAVASPNNIRATVDGRLRTFGVQNFVLVSRAGESAPAPVALATGTLTPTTNQRVRTTREITVGPGIQRATIPVGTEGVITRTGRARQHVRFFQEFARQRSHWVDTTAVENVPIPTGYVEANDRDWASWVVGDVLERTHDDYSMFAGQRATITAKRNTDTPYPRYDLDNGHTRERMGWKRVLRLENPADAAPAATEWRLAVIGDVLVSGDKIKLTSEAVAYNRTQYSYTLNTDDEYEVRYVGIGDDRGLNLEPAGWVSRDPSANVGFYIRSAEAPATPAPRNVQVGDRIRIIRDQGGTIVGGEGTVTEVRGSGAVYYDGPTRSTTSSVTANYIADAGYYEVITPGTTPAAPETRAVEEIQVDDPRLAHIWKTAALKADEAGFCSEYERIVDLMGIPGREKNRYVTIQFGSPDVTERVRVSATSQKAAEGKVAAMNSREKVALVFKDLSAEDIIRKVARMATVTVKTA